MNHLGCDGNMKVVFDAGDAKLECDDEEGEEGAKEEEDVREEEGDVEVDISRLRGSSPTIALFYSSCAR